MNAHRFCPRLEIIEDRYTPATLQDPVGMAVPAGDAPAQTAPAQPESPTAAPTGTSGPNASTGGQQGAFVSGSFFLGSFTNTGPTVVNTGPVALVSTSLISAVNTGPIGSLPLEAANRVPANANALGQFPASPSSNAGGGVSAANANSLSPNPLNETTTSSDASLTGPLSGTSTAGSQNSAGASAT